MGTMSKEYMKKWRDEHRSHIQKYNRDAYHRAVCDMDCFNCKFPDCKNNKAPTKEERRILEDVMGLNNETYKAYHAEQQREKHRAYMRARYRMLKEMNAK